MRYQMLLDDKLHLTADNYMTLRDLVIAYRKRRQFVGQHVEIRDTESTHRYHSTI